MLGHLLKRKQSNQCNKFPKLIRVQTWGFGTDHKLDQVDFTARMSFLSANQRESTLSDQTPLSANTWSPWQHLVWLQRKFSGFAFYLANRLGGTHKGNCAPFSREWHFKVIY